MGETISTQLPEIRAARDQAPIGFCARHAMEFPMLDGTRNVRRPALAARLHRGALKPAQ